MDANGNLSAGATNAGLNQILNQPTFDVVFFTNYPLNGKQATPANLAGVLGCSTNPTSALCAKLQPLSLPCVHSRCPGPPAAPTVKPVPPDQAASMTGPNDPNVVTYTWLGLTGPNVSV